MTLENKTNTALICRIVAVFILTVIVLIAALFAPQNVPSAPSITTMNKNEYEKNDNNKYNEIFDVTHIALDENEISNHKYWMDKHATSKCHYHDAIYHLGTDCSLQQCYTNNNKQTFDNQLIFKTDQLLTKQFIQQIHSINSSLLNYINHNNNNITSYRIQIDVHMILEYFCCYTADEYDIIIEAIKLFQFKPFNISFDRFVCIGEDKIVLFADAISQQYLSILTDKMEEYLRDNYNIPIHSHRRDAQPFHLTLLEIESDIFGLLEIVNYLNHKYNKWQYMKLKVDKRSELFLFKLKI